jgi:hypothetical protein
MWALIIILIILFLLAGFLFSPIVFYIDTEENRYEIRQTPVFKFCLSLHGHQIIPGIKLIGINVPLPRAGNKKKKERRDAVKPRRKSFIHKSASTWRRTLAQIVKSFFVQSIIVDVDTDDVVMNAQLVPLFTLLSSERVCLTTNYSGRAYFHFEGENRPARLLWILIRFFTKK